MKKANRKNNNYMDTRMMSYLDKREKDLDLREVHMQQREDGMKQREDGMKQREDGMLQREADMAQREMRMTEREDRMTVRENQMSEREGVMHGRQKKGNSKPVLDEHGVVTLPDELLTEKAQEVLKKFQEAGFLTADFQPLDGYSRPDVSMIAQYMSYAIFGKNKWKVFEDLWGEKQLSSSYSQKMRLDSTESLIEKLNKVIPKV